MSAPLGPIVEWIKIVANKIDKQWQTKLTTVANKTDKQKNSDFFSALSEQVSDWWRKTRAISKIIRTPLRFFTLIKFRLVDFCPHGFLILC